MKVSGSGAAAAACVLLGCLPIAWPCAAGAMGYIRVAAAAAVFGGMG